MNSQDPLAALQPLRDPAAIHWWPPAPGWWLLAGLLILAIAALAYWIATRRGTTRYRRQGVQQLQLLLDDFDQHNDPVRCVTQINALLKSVALRAYPRESISRHHGGEWVAFLNAQIRASSTEQTFTPNCFDAVYQRESPSPDIEHIKRAALYWIKHHRPAQ